MRLDDCTRTVNVAVRMCDSVVTVEEELRIDDCTLNVGAIDLHDLGSKYMKGFSLKHTSLRV